MTRDEFRKTLLDNIDFYINNFYRFDSNPQLRVNPDTLGVTLVNGSDILSEIGDNDEAIEAAAASHGMAWQEASDMQVTQNPDFYAVKSLLKSVGDDKTEADGDRVEFIINTYFKKN